LETTQTTPAAVSLDDLHTVEQLAAAHANILTVPALRWQLRHRDENGLTAAGVCVKVGKKLLLIRPRYEVWLGTRAGKASK
jgi:hypothetical protein